MVFDVRNQVVEVCSPCRFRLIVESRDEVIDGEFVG